MLKAEQRSGLAQRNTLIHALALLGLAAAKGGAALATGSKALLADACHSAADFAHAFTAYAGVRDARRVASGAAKNGRPTGETTASVVLAAMLLVIGFEMGLYALRALAEGVDGAPGWEAILIIALGMALRESVARVKRTQDMRLGLRPDPLQGGENRADVFASLAALAGALGAKTGEWLNLPVLYALDPAAAIVVAVFVLRHGWRLATLAVRSAEDAVQTDGFDVRMLLEAVQRMEGVVAVDELKVREYGHYIVADLVIRVNPRISVLEAHDIAARVRRHLTRRFLHVADAIVHVQPYEPVYPYKTNLQDEEAPTLLQ